MLLLLFFFFSEEYFFRKKRNRNEGKTKFLFEYITYNEIKIETYYKYRKQIKMKTTKKKKENLCRLEN